MLKFLKWTFLIWATLLVMTIIHEGAHYAACRYCGIVPTKVLIGPYPGIGGTTIKTPATFFFIGWFPDGGATYYDGRAYLALSPAKRMLIDAAGIVTHVLALLLVPFLAFGGGRKTPWQMLRGLPLKLLASLRGLVCFFFGWLYIPRLDPKPEEARWSFKDFIVFISAFEIYANFFPANTAMGTNDGYALALNFALACNIPIESVFLGLWCAMVGVWIVAVVAMRYALTTLAIHCMTQEVVRAGQIIRTLQARAGAEAEVPSLPTTPPRSPSSEERFRGGANDGLPPNPPQSS